MAFSSNTGSGPMADINVTPLVDVMLVLLIIFMVTAPALSYQIQVDLPQKTNTPPPQIKNPPDPIKIRIDAGGTIYLDGAPVSLAMVDARFRGDATLPIQPVVELQTDRDAEYAVLAKVLARAKNAQLEKISFVENGQP